MGGSAYLLTKTRNSPYTSDMAKKKPTRRPKKQIDPEAIMAEIKAVFAKSGMSMQKLGEAMGYEPTTARQSVSQFMKSKDPRMSMVLRFADATGKKITDFLK
jgi:lambda repressor-like predicted transcriptional regulator